MIVREDKTIETNSMFLNTNWYDDENNYIIDETTEEGQLMAQTYIENYPFVDFEHDGEFVTNVIVLNKPVKPPEVEGKEVTLVKDATGEWVYVYEDVPLTREQELEQQVADLQGQMNLLFR